MEEVVLSISNSTALNGTDANVAFSSGTIPPTPLVDIVLSLEEDDMDMSSLSEAEDKALSLLPIFSGLLSVWGSANIISIILRSRSNSMTSYKRIMLGLSCSDILCSLVFCFQPFLLPAETSPRVWASGTDATCSVMGFFQQLSLSTYWYNGMLSFMFLWTIRYSVSEEKLAQKYESWMHGLSIGFPLVTATIAALLGIYGELKVGHMCWVTGENAALIAYAIAGIPSFFFFFAIPINNWLVYRHVRNVATKVEQQEPAEYCYLSKVSATAAVRSKSDETAATARTSSNDGSAAMLTEEEMRQQREERRNQARQQSQQDRQKERVQAVAFQAFLYVASFLITQLPSTVLRILAAALQLQSADEAQFFPLLVLQAILWPLQGLFNYLIYCRGPTYLRET